MLRRGTLPNAISDLARAATTVFSSDDTSEVRPIVIPKLPRLGEDIPSDLASDCAWIMERLGPEMTDPNYDIVAKVLDDLPMSREISEDFLELQIDGINKSLMSINAKLSMHVDDRYAAFVEGINQIQNLKIELGETAELCREGRLILDEADKLLIDGPVALIEAYRRHLLIKDFNDDVEKIHSLTILCSSVRKDMSSANYYRAIELYQLCKRAQPLYAQVSAARHLIKNIEEARTMILSELSKAFVQTSRAFSPDRYETILKSYFMMEEARAVFDIVENVYRGSIDTVSSECVLRYALENVTDSTELDNIERSDFKSKCARLGRGNYQKAFFHVIDRLAWLMFQNHLAVKWHSAYQSPANVLDAKVCDLGNTLSEFRKEIWEEVQRKVATFLQATQSRILNQQMDDFLIIFRTIRKFIEFGLEYSGHASTILHASLTHVTKIFFETHHGNQILAMQDMIEHESWERCLVPVTFGIKDVVELYSFIKLQRKGRHINQSHTWLSDFESGVNPFGKDNIFKQHPVHTEDETLKDNAPQDDEEEESQELQQDFIDEEKKLSLKQGASKSKNSNDERGPILTTSVINMSRKIGEYMLFLQDLDLVAPEIFICASQIICFYTFSVYSLFMGNLHNQGPENSTIWIPASLTTSLQWMYRFICTRSWYKFPKDAKLDAAQEAQHLPPRPFALQRPSIISKPNNYHALHQRLAAAESLKFLHDVLVSVSARLEDMLPKDSQAQLKEYLEHMKVALGESQSFMYRLLAHYSLQLDSIILKIEKHKWNIKSQEGNSPYIEELARAMEGYGDILRALVSDRAPAEVSRVLWESTIVQTLCALVEGYSRIKQCTKEGRDVMEKDFQYFMTKVELKCPIRPLPSGAIVERYIAAFFFNENQFMNFVRDHQARITCLFYDGLID
eukprot:TRINITY_DN9947_c0_g1_i2.p1 TRINITY_DN9947_c0_g1~~TRINITY_DN9947_c0_g1_i2.p1  ORF type:complete len:910 (+),score=191.04 TRINITY_DN9947_c0_g1_i2:63-2792(+)